MKNSRPTLGRRAFSQMLLAGIIIATTLGTAHATNYYWDVNGNGAGSGVTGTQHTWAAGFFSTDPNGLAGTSTTTTGNTSLPGASDDVYFSAGTDATIAYASAVSGNQSIKGLILNTNGTGQLTLGGTTATLTLGSDGVTVNGGAASSTTTVLSITTGSSSGASLIIGANQTWTIANGIMQVSSNINYANQLTFGSGTFIIGSGGGPASAYTGAGGVHINGGNVQLTSTTSKSGNNDLGTGAIELSSGSLQEVAGASGALSLSNATTVDGSFTFGSNGAEPLTFTNGVTFSNTPTVTLNSAGGINFSGSTSLHSNVTFTGNSTAVTSFTTGISDDANNRSVTFSGGGRYNLSAGSSYTGGTTISGGTVIASNTLGSATGTGSVTLSGTGLLGGSGIIGTSGVTSGTAITIASGATLSPGGQSSTSTLTPSAATVLTFNLQSGASMQLNSGSKFVFDLGAMNLSDSVTPGTATSDLIRVTGGTLNLNSIDLSDFTIKMLAGFNVGNYNLFAADAPGDITGTLGPLLTQSFSFGGLPYAYTLAITNGGQDLTLEVVPEPSTWAMMLGGLGVLIFYVRRRNLSGKSRV
jgi:fibronectin-binding autotransporter adhesin